MKINTQSIMGELDRFGVALADRSYVLSVAFARAVAYQLPLPTSPVADPYAAFIETQKVAVEDMLSQVNESVVLSFDATADLVQRLWVFRYRMVFDPNNSAVRGFLDAMIRVGSRELPPKLSEMMVNYASSDVLDAITRVVGAAVVGEA